MESEIDNLVSDEKPTERQVREMFETRSMAAATNRIKSNEHAISSSGSQVVVDKDELIDMMTKVGVSTYYRLQPKGQKQ